MLILGIDTANRESTVALLRAAAGGLHTLELARVPEGRASEQLLPAIDALLAGHGVAKEAISLVAVANGPGSFTGLRVAVATAKGLAEAFSIPVIAVSALEAVAVAARGEGPVVAVLDAQRGELFFGEYILDASGAVQSLREDIAALPGFLAELATLRAAQPGLRLVTSDAALAAQLPAAAPVVAPSADDIARIAYGKFLAGLRCDVAALDANYLRRSDAEIVFSRKPESVAGPR